MSDTPRDAPSHTDVPHTGIPVHETVNLLAISENAVRARLRRGTLVGVKHDTSWYVVLRATDIPTTAPAAKIDVPEDAPQHIPAHTAVHDEMIEELRADKRYLQEQLDRALRQLEAERQRTDVLQALAAQAGTSQPKPETPPHSATMAPGSPETSESTPTGLGETGNMAAAPAGWGEGRGMR